MITDNNNNNGIPSVTRNRVQLTKPVQTYNNGRAVSMQNSLSQQLTPAQQKNFSANANAFNNRITAKPSTTEPRNDMNQARMKAINAQYQRNQSQYPNRIALDNLLNAFAEVDENDAMQFMNMVATGQVLPKQSSGQQAAEESYLQQNQQQTQQTQPSVSPWSPDLPKGATYTYKPTSDPYAEPIPEEGIIGERTAPMDSNGNILMLNY